MVSRLTGWRTILVQVGAIITLVGGYFATQGAEDPVTLTQLLMGIWAALSIIFGAAKVNKLIASNGG